MDEQGDRFDRRAGTATIGTGVQLIDVYAGLAAHGATIPAGSCPSVGIAGVTLGGGMGLAGRAFGLTADNLRAAQIVTADGRRREVDGHSDPELLWALRGGGGGNFGIVTSLQFRVHRLPRSAAWFVVSWPWRSAEEALAAWQSWAPHARDELTLIFHLQTGSRSPSVLVAGQYLGPSRDLRRLLAPLTGVSGARAQTGDQDYLGLQLRWAGCLHQSLSRCHTAGTSPGGHAGARQLPGEVRLCGPSAVLGGAAEADRGDRDQARSVGVRGHPVRRLRRLDQPGRAARDGVRAPPSAASSTWPTTAARRGWGRPTRACDPTYRGWRTRTTSTPTSRAGAAPTTARTTRVCSRSGAGSIPTTGSTSRRPSAAEAPAGAANRVEHRAVRRRGAEGAVSLRRSAPQAERQVNQQPHAEAARAPVEV